MVLAAAELLASDREALAANGAELIAFPKIDVGSIVTLAQFRAGLIGASGVLRAVCQKAA